jgi:hypothetical protein
METDDPGISRRLGDIICDCPRLVTYPTQYNGWTGAVRGRHGRGRHDCLTSIRQQRLRREADSPSVIYRRVVIVTVFAPQDSFL